MRSSLSKGLIGSKSKAMMMEDQSKTLINTRSSASVLKMSKRGDTHQTE